VSGPSLLIADHPPTRAGIRMAVGEAAAHLIEAGNAEEAIALAEQAQPAVAIVGLEITGGGIAAVEGILRASPETRIVALTASPTSEGLITALRAGAIGYLPATIDAEALRRVVGAVAGGEAAIPRSMVIEMANELRLRSSGGDGLTVREAQVLSMLKRGDSTAAIAERLSISPVTVRRHISTLMQKTGVDRRADLLAVDVRMPIRDPALWPEPVGV